MVWCPTIDMIEDFLIKPLEGDLFRKFKDQIMGMIPAEDPGPEKSQPVKAQPRKGTAKKRQAKERKSIYIFKFGPASREAPQECVGRS